MRKDIYERMKIMKKDEIKPNYAALAKQLGCDYRTVKKYYEQDLSGKVVNIKDFHIQKQIKTSYN